MHLHMTAGMRRFVALLPLVIASRVALAQNAEPVDLTAIARIRAEAFEHSQVMTMMSWLTDVHGHVVKGILA